MTSAATPPVPTAGHRRVARRRPRRAASSSASARGSAGPRQPTVVRRQIAQPHLWDWIGRVHRRGDERGVTESILRRGHRAPASTTSTTRRTGAKRGPRAWGSTPERGRASVRARPGNRRRQRRGRAYLRRHPPRHPRRHRAGLALAGVWDADVGRGVRRCGRERGEGSPRRPPR